MVTQKVGTQPSTFPLFDCNLETQTSVFGTETSSED